MKKILLIPICGALIFTLFGTMLVFADGDKLIVSPPIILDLNGNPIIGPVQTGQQILFGVNLTNNQNKDQPFTYVLQIKDGQGVTVDLSWITGTIAADQTFGPMGNSWTPTASGTYTAQIFIWNSIDNPVQLSNPHSITFKIQGGKHVSYDTVPLSGTVSPPFRDHNAVLFIFDPKNNLVQIAHAPVANDGKFSTNIIAGGPLFKMTGNYTVLVKYFGVKQNSLSFNCNSLSPISCSAN